MERIVWKTIPGFPGYQVSNLPAVRSFWFGCPASIGATPKMLKMDGKEGTYRAVRSRAANAADAKKNGLWTEGERHGQAKLSDALALEIYRRANEGELGCNLALEFSISAGQVSDIKNKKQWVHIHKLQEACT